MSTQEKGVNLPSKESIEQWNTLNSNIISESATCAVPNTVFIQYDNESFYNRVLFEKEIPFLTASSNVTNIKVFSDLINQADELIYSVYSRRSLSSALSPFIQAKKESKVDESFPYYQEIFDLCSKTINFLNSSANILHGILDAATIWQGGHYSDSLLHTICQLFYKVTTLDEMKLFKSSLANDLTYLKGLAKGAQFNDSNIQKIQMNINSAQYFETTLLNLEEGRSKSDKQKISQIFIPFISSNLEKENFLVPESLYMYIRFLMFLCKYTEQDSKTIQLLAQQAQKHPLLPLAFEVSIKISDYCSSIKGFTKDAEKYQFDPKTIPNRMRDITNDLQTWISELPSKIDSASQKIMSSDEFLGFLMNLIHSIASLKNSVREQYAYKLTITPPETPGEVKSQFPYERSIRKGYTHEELNVLIRAIMLWRSICDQLRDSSAAILPIISEAITVSFQSFVKDCCQKVMRKAKKEVEQKIQDIIMTLSTHVGDWNAGPMYPNIKKKNAPLYPVVNRSAPPNLEAIEFVRIQLQHIFNPTSEYLKNGYKKSFKNDKIISRVNNFMSKSFQYTTILQFNQLISNIADQSDLYFKEVQLSLNKTINFPVKSSLPYVLCEYALQNFKTPEITELVFFPLGIYDDAAHVASTKLHSLFLLDEIRAESQMCLEALTSLISDFIFLSFRTFVSVKLIPENVRSNLQLTPDQLGTKSSLEPKPEMKQGGGKYNTTISPRSPFMKGRASTLSKEVEIKPQKRNDWQESRPYRFTSLLQQNHFYLLYSLIDVKSMITKQIESIITQNLNNLVKTTSSNVGTGSLIAVFHGIQILRETHRLLCDQGVALPSFDNLLNVAFQNTVPTSYLSLFVQNIVTNLSEKVVHHCYLMTNPLSLYYPSKVRSLPSYTFGKQLLGKGLKNAFDHTISPITVDHFGCFSHLLENGELAVFIQTLSEAFRTQITDFISTYEKIDSMNLHRIKDLPLSTPAQTVYEHFIEAYGSLVSDTTINECFAEMKALGNMLAAAYMLDIALMNSRLTREEIIGFFKGQGKDGNCVNDVDRLFPKVVAEELKSDDSYLFAYGTDIFPITLTLCLDSIIKAIKAFEKVELFDEKSPSILDFPSLTGFASRWSILEFIFVYAEAGREKENESPFQLYGEGVMLLAAALILFMSQEKIYHVINVGRKIQRVIEVDSAASKDDILSRFCLINKFETATMDWAIQLFSPIIKSINSDDQA